MATLNYQRVWSFLLHDLSSLEPTQSGRAGEGTSEALGVMIEASSHNDEETLVWERLKALDFPENRWDYIFVKVGRSLSLSICIKDIYIYIHIISSLYLYIYIYMIHHISYIIYLWKFIIYQKFLIGEFVLDSYQVVWGCSMGLGKNPGVTLPGSQAGSYELSFPVAHNIW